MTSPTSAAPPQGASVSDHDPETTQPAPAEAHYFSKFERKLLIIADGLLTPAAEAALDSKGWKTLYASTRDDADALARQHDVLVGLVILPEPFDLHRFQQLRDIVVALHHLEWVGALGRPALGREDVKRFIVARLHDFHILPVDPDRLSTVVGHAGGLASLGHSLQQTDVAKELSRFGLLGAGSAMRALYSDIARISSVDLPVLITGDSGTGKELTAQAIHTHSVRASGPYVALNCAAIPISLMQSEFFGHEKGAFTNATERRIGKFEAADGGTLLLDEIAELPLEGQAALLRVLEDSRVTRLGGTGAKLVDVRIIASTNRDLEERVRSGLFREDLYYRLAVLCIHMPALRERGADIELLAQHFLRAAAEAHGKRIDGLDADALALLHRYDFPGNLRELRSWISRAALTCRGRVLRPADLSKAAPARRRTELRLTTAVSSAEKGALEQALADSAWNITESAKTLGVSRMTLYRMMKRHGISRSAEQAA